ASVATVHVPPDAAGETLHVVLAVTDTGQPPLTRYRRAIVTGQAAAAAQRILRPFFEPPPAFAGRFGSYRSPMLLADGRHIDAPADWGRRRAEILKEWTGL